MALALASRLSSSSPTLNFLGAELALALEDTCFTRLVPRHLAGKLNVTADALSRLGAPGGPDRAAVLALVGTAKIRNCPQREQAFYKLPTPGNAAELWGSVEEAAPGAAWATVTEQL